MTYEQYYQGNLSSLLSKPLIIGCPIEQIDTFTLNLLSYDEVIKIYLDTLGKSARLVSKKNGIQIWTSPLEDGSIPVEYLMSLIMEKSPKSHFR